MAAEATSSELSAFETELISRVHSFFPNSEPDKFYFFYETASPFSNFHPCSFEENGLVFTSSEKYMMYRKASNAHRSLVFLFFTETLSKSYSATSKSQAKF